MEKDTEIPEALASIRRGIQDAKEGKLVYLGSFQKYINWVNESICSNPPRFLRKYLGVVDFKGRLDWL